MNDVTRRQFLKYAGMSSAVLAIPVVASETTILNIDRFYVKTSLKNITGATLGVDGDMSVLSNDNKGKIWNQRNGGNICLTTDYFEFKNKNDRICLISNSDGKWCELTRTE